MMTNVGIGLAEEARFYGKRHRFTVNGPTIERCAGDPGDVGACAEPDTEHVRTYSYATDHDPCDDSMEDPNDRPFAHSFEDLCPGDCDCDHGQTGDDDHGEVVCWFPTEGGFTEYTFTWVRDEGREG